MHRRPQRRNRAEANAKAPRIPPGFFGIGPLRRRDHERRAGVGTVQGVEHARGIAHAARQHVLTRRAFPAFAFLGSGRDAAATGAQPEQAAVRSRDADRAAAVGGPRHRHDAGSNRRSRTTGRPAGRAIRIPGVACRSKQHGFGLCLQRQLRGRGFAEDNQAGREKTVDDLGVLGRSPGSQRAAARRGRHTGVMLADVLDQKRHAGERPGQSIRRAFARELGHRNADRIDPRAHGFRARKCRFQQFGGADFPSRNEVGETGGVVLRIFLEHSAQSKPADFFLMQSQLRLVSQGGIQ